MLGEAEDRHLLDSHLSQLLHMKKKMINVNLIKIEWLEAVT
jgi:hypothetical protein